MDPKDALQKVSDFLSVSPFDNVAARKVHATPYTATVTERERIYLQDTFREEVQRLEQDLNWDCSDWMDN